jgi:hypothetical protein
VTAGADLVEAHVRALGDRLRGPARLRRSLLSEVRSGLLDAVDAETRTRPGSDPVAAQLRAISDFGTPGELAPEFQDQLVAAQARRSAVLLAVVFPGLLVAWDLLWAAGIEWDGPASPVVRRLARMEDLLSGTVGLAALLALLLLVRSARRRQDPRRIALCIGVLGAAGATAGIGLALLMNVLAGPVTDQARTGLSDRPLALPAYLLSGALLAVALRSVVSTLRLARQPAG